MPMKDCFSVLTSKERIKLEKCAVTDGVRNERGWRGQSVLSIDLVLRAESQGCRPSCEWLLIRSLANKCGKWSRDVKWSNSSESSWFWNKFAQCHNLLTSESVLSITELIKAERGNGRAKGTHLPLVLCFFFFALQCHKYLSWILSCL